MFHLLTYLLTPLRAREEGDNSERATWLADWPMARYCCVSSRYDGQLMDCDDDPSTSVRLPEPPPPPPLGFLQSTVVHTQSHTHTHTGKVRQSGDGTRIRHAGYDSVARDSEKSRSFIRHPHVKWPMPRPNADIKCSGLTPRIFRIVYRYFWAYPFLLFSSSFSTFLLLVPCGRISWLMLAFEPML